MNANPSPPIDSSRQKAGQQLEAVDPVEVIKNLACGNSIKPPSPIQSSNGGNRSYRAVSRRAAAQATNDSKIGKGLDKDTDMK